MSDWINDEVESIREKDRQQQGAQSRADLIAKEAMSFWVNLNYAVKNDIETINATPTIVKKLGCKLSYHELNAFSFKVVKETYPAVYLTVERSNGHIAVERQVVASPNPRNPVTEHERLVYDLDDDKRIYLKTEGLESLYLENAVGYLLKPLLNY